MRTDLSPVPSDSVIATDESLPKQLENQLVHSARVTDFVPDNPEFSFHALPACPHPWRHPLRAVMWLMELLFGLMSLFLFLAVLAAIPLVNVLALGYLLEAEGRVARTGKIRYCLPLLPLAPRLGSIVLGFWLWLWPIRWVTDAAADAELIAPDSSMAEGWKLAKVLLTTAITIHLILALSRGGGFWCFFRPIRNLRWLIAQFRAGTYLETAVTAVWEFFAALRIRHHFSLGIRGFCGAFVWLFLPTLLFAAMQSTQKPGQVLVTLMGGLLLTFVLVWTPFLQAHFAAENRLSAFRELSRIRELLRRAPLASFLSLVLLYALALPLSLTKVAVPPRDAVWLITPIFIATIYPARIFIGWSYARAMRKEQRSWWFIRWPMRCALFPLLAVYLFLFFFTPAIDAYGRRVLFEQHALLLPSPF